MCHCRVGAVLDFPEHAGASRSLIPMATPPDTPGRQRRVLSGGFRPLWGRGSQPCWFCRIPSHPQVCPCCLPGPGLWAERLQDGTQPCLLGSRAERRGPAQRRSAGLGGNAGSLSARLPTHVLPSVSGSPRGALGQPGGPSSCPWCLRRPSSSLVCRACKWPGLG